MTIYWQSKCQILVQAIKANNKYSGFCEVTQNTSVLGLTSYTKTWN